MGAVLWATGIPTQPCYTTTFSGRVPLDLPPGGAKDDAIANNLASLPWDGLQSIESDGTVVFTQATSRALFDLTGRHYESLAPDNAESMANELIAAVE